MEMNRTDPFPNLEVPQGFSPGLKGVVEGAVMVMEIVIAALILAATALSDLIKKLPPIVIYPR